MAIEVQALGSVRVTRDGLEVAGLAAQRIRLALLVYLAVERERTRDAVLGVLWPEREQEKARHALNQTLYELRRVLGAKWLDVSGDRLLVTDTVVSDARLFEQALKGRADAHALELYRGPFLEGLYLAETAEFEAWVEGVRGRYGRLFGEASRRVVRQRVEAGDVTGALGVAQRWVELEPLEDDAHHQVIALLAEAGRGRDALREFETYARGLREDGLEPNAELAALVERIRAGAVQAPFRTVVSWPENVAPRRRMSARHVIETADGQAKTLALGSSRPVGPRLIRILQGGGEAEAYLLRGESNTIGRYEGSLLFPEDTLMSAAHAELSRRESGGEGGEVASRFFIRDVGSHNGVYIRIRDEWPLHEGDQFALGRQVFRFERTKVSEP